MYNKNKCGVDQLDARCRLFEFPHKCNRWTVVVLFHLLNMAFHNAYTLYKEEHQEEKPLPSFMEFMLGVARCKGNLYETDKGTTA